MGAAVPIITAALSTGTQLYQARQQRKTAAKARKDAASEAARARKMADKEKKADIAKAGVDAGRKNKRLRAYQKPKQSLVSNSAATQKLG